VAGLARAEAAYEQAKIRQTEAEKNRPLDVKIAARLVEQAKAQVDQIDIDVKKLGAMDPNVKNAVEEQKAQATYNSAFALWEKSKVDLERTQNDEPIQINSAKQDVIVAEAIRDSAKKDLDEARERLNECTVKS